ncbi:LysR substrate-binding domain-containing protein [Pokkaliibacter plantistimulans]|nr:LysR substrate-binding domain-containing protein [Pokkaliibacter plantistimulans]
MEVSWLEDFLTLAVTRNFSRAAELRNVTQPAFSRRIRNLEYWVGATLVDRSIFPIILTPAGDVFRKTAQETLDSLRNGREEAQGFVPKAGEIVSIAASHTLAVSFFSDWHMKLQAKIGKIKVRVVADHVAGCIEALITDNCDLMLSYSNPALPSLADIERYPYLTLSQERLVPVSIPKPDKTPFFDLNSEKTLPLLCYSSNSYLGRLTAAIIEREKLSPRLDFSVECSMSEVLKRGALAGAGIAWIPEGAARQELDSGALVIAGGINFTSPLAISLFRKIEPTRTEVEKVWSASMNNHR